ncbi:hypothetical protein QA641_36800 [Bradyrhizobium sp. CB1650]|nr:hypothetical protein [Bradyrhizobium sp. CB1650]WGD51061.1 hypothetical protein QA641_36800 [Bradyrhizobium sp. CB1650]
MMLTNERVQLREAAVLKAPAAPARSAAPRLRAPACLGLLGSTSFAEVNKSCLHRATETNAPSVFSAFPLFDHEPYRY